MALASVLAGFMPKPETGPAKITLQQTSKAGNQPGIFFKRSDSEVNRTMLIIIKAMRNSVMLPQRLHIFPELLLRNAPARQSVNVPEESHQYTASNPPIN